jgi:hypothetical protein
MFFDDDKKLKKVDMGTKKILKKEDFLKKIEDSKKVQEDKPKKDHYYSIISRFVKKLYDSPLFRKFCKIEEIKTKSKNLENIVLLNKKPDYNELQKEKISITAFQKIKNDLEKITLSLLNSKMIDLIKNLINVLKFIKPQQLEQIVKADLIFFKNLFVVSIVNLYIYLKKQYLIDENFVFFEVYNLVYSYLNNQEIISKLSRKFGRNKSFLFMMVYILKNYTRFITDQARIKFLNFAFKINDIYLVQTKNKIVNEFFEYCVAGYLEMIDSPKNYEEVMQAFKESDIFFYLTKSNSNDFLNYLSETKSVIILSKIANDVNNPNLKNKVKLDDENVVIFKKLFNTIRKQHLNLSSGKLERLKLNRQNILKMVNDILDYLFGNYSNSNIKELILLIWYSGKLLENLYQDSMEKNGFYNILDYLVNKIVIKYYNKILDDILKFSVQIVLKLIILDR